MQHYLNYYKQVLDCLYEISKVLSSSINRQTALDNVLAILSDSIRMRHGMILLYNNATNELEVAAALGLKIEKSTIRYQSGEGIVGRVFRHGIPMIIPDVAQEPIFLNRMQRTPDRPFSFIAVPIKDETTTIGVFAVDKDVVDMHATSTDVNLLKMISTLLVSFLLKVKSVEQERDALLSEKSRLETEVRQKYRFGELIGSSKAMRQVFTKIATVAKTKTTVLIRGESGSGKEVIAKTIHFNGDRAQKPFVAVNCAAIPKELIESELFGYEKGAFTGAAGEKKGKFELANGGTIFLDEIGDMPYEAQSKLLRVLQDLQVERIGGTKSIKVDVRVVAATNRNLEEAVRSGEFRLDLYYRLNVVTIFLPPLREHPEDIPALAHHIIKRFNDQYGTSLQLSQELLGILMKCGWPGNVRELENCLERAALEAGNGMIEARHLACVKGEVCFSHLMHGNPSGATMKVPPISSSVPIPAKDEQAEQPRRVTMPDHDAPAQTEDEREKAELLHALEQAGWVQAKAARLLGMTVRQINYRIQKFGINVRKL